MTVSSRTTARSGCLCRKRLLTKCGRMVWDWSFKDMEWKMYEWVSQRKCNTCSPNGWILQQEKEPGRRYSSEMVLSPTSSSSLYDVLEKPSTWVHEDMFGDDRALWCSEESMYMQISIYRLQQALDILDYWTEQRLVKINPAMTTYTVFSLSQQSPRQPAYRLPDNALRRKTILHFLELHMTQC